jgi:hypothetical protein
VFNLYLFTLFQKVLYFSKFGATGDLFCAFKKYFPDPSLSPISNPGPYSYPDLTQTPARSPKTLPHPTEHLSIGTQTHFLPLGLSRTPWIKIVLLLKEGQGQGSSVRSCWIIKVVWLIGLVTGQFIGFCFHDVSRFYGKEITRFVYSLFFCIFNIVHKWCRWIHPRCSRRLSCGNPSKISKTQLERSDHPQTSFNLIFSNAKEWVFEIFFCYLALVLTVT